MHEVAFSIHQGQDRLLGWAGVRILHNVVHCPDEQNLPVNVNVKNKCEQM